VADLKRGKLQEAISLYNDSVRLFEIKKVVELKVGQIRVLTNKDNPELKKIVIVASASETLETRTCDVILTHDQIELSSKRDFNSLPNLKTSSVAFGIMTDFIGNVDVWQLGDEVLGNICFSCVASLFIQSNQADPQDYALPNNHECLSRGECDFKVLDNVWKYRQDNYLSFLLDCNNFDDRESFMKNRKRDFYLEVSTSSTNKNRYAPHELASRINTPEQLAEFEKSSSQSYERLLVLR
jgi:hypothetical protein